MPTRTRREEEMRARRASVTICVGLLAAAALPRAVAGAWRTLILDPASTRVSMTLDATLHRVEGEIGPGSGTIEFDLDTLAARGEVVVDLEDASTNIGRRDRKMHQKILETDRYPRAVFRPERISGPQRLQRGTNELVLDGSLELHGVRRPVSLAVRAEVSGREVTALASTTVPYLDFGIRDPSFFVLRVAKQVDIDIVAVGRLAASVP